MYKHYAIIENGVVVEYPVNPRVWVVSQNSYNVPEVWQGGELDGKTYVACHMPIVAQKPTENLVEKTPVFDQEIGFWMRQFDVVSATAEEVAERRPRYLQGAVNVLAAKLQEYNEKLPLILQLPLNEQIKWQEYAASLMTISQQPEYPFVFHIPESPENQVTVKIGVARI